MSRRNWQLFVEDMLESIGLIRDYTAGLKFADFEKDRKTVDAVVRNFEVLGEASRFVPENIRQRYAEVDWQAIIGLRNRIAHEYFGISLSILWHIVEEELPKLQKQLQNILTWEKP